MIISGRLKATKVGIVWMIDPKDLDAVKDRKVGRPRKSAQDFKAVKADSTIAFVETPEKDRCDHSGQ